MTHTILRLLIVEDSASDASLLVRHLKKTGFAVDHQRVDDAAQLQAALKQEWDVVLSDFSLPGFSAAQALDILHQSGRDIPFIIVSGVIDDEAAIELMRTGCHDYLIKDNLARLAPAIERELREARVRMERRRAHVALHESESRFRALANNGRALIWTARADMLRDYFNEPWLEFTGRTLSQETGQGWADNIHPEDIAHCRDGYLAASGKREKFSLLYRMRRHDGAYRWMIDEGTPRYDHAGNYIGYISHCLDITEVRQAEEKLLLAARVFQTAQEGIVMTDASGMIVAVNPAFLRMTGFSEQEVLGQPTAMFYSERHDAAFYHAIGLAVTATGHWRGEVYSRRKDGSALLTWTTTTAIRDDRGKVTDYVSMSNDISEIKNAYEQLDFLASHDPLTRLPNRTLLNDRISQALAMSERSGRQVALLMLNIDRLQRVNDSLGYDAGDAVLKEMAQRLQALMMPGDTLARLGSDEFVLLLTQSVDAENVMASARLLLDTVARPLRVHGNDVHLTGSIGIDMYPNEGYAAGDLLKGADTALSHVKNNGRNGFRFYTASMNVRAERWMSLENHLRHAIERDELTLYYQPQVSLGDGRICGMEALVRWRSPELGLISPADFIPLTEDNGLITPIGEWVMRTACSQNKAWQQAGLPPLRIAVNVSAQQLAGGDFLNMVQRTLHDTGLEARYLEVELTESVLMHETESTLAQFAGLRETGVKISLDDFGTGYSSLSYLSRFSLDKLKIDQGFVRNITAEPKSAAIAHATIALAHGLGITVIAEGVETAGQLGYLRTAGCDQIQGFLFSRPLPPEEMAILMQQDKSLPLNPGALTHGRTLLLIENDRATLEALIRLLSRDGYRILVAHSAHEAFELLASNAVQIIISDQRISDMSGIDFLGHAGDLHPGTIRMLMGRHADLKEVTDALNRSAIDKFLDHPWDNESLRETVADAFRRVERGHSRRH